jgi:VIT1/CCC1 family predicted Fe2+/Mn2+ transporter
MAMGEWISVQSSRELYTHQIDIERFEIATMPEAETQELALIYEAKGLPRPEARALAERIMSDADTALDAMAREELSASTPTSWAARLPSPPSPRSCRSPPAQRYPCSRSPSSPGPRPPS